MKRPAFLLGVLFVGKYNLENIKITSWSNFTGTSLCLILGFVRAESNCTNRRCLAQMLINKEHFSQPQYENCTLPIEVPFIEYQTLSVVSNFFNVS